MAFPPKSNVRSKDGPHLLATGIRWQDRDGGIVELLRDDDAVADQIARIFFSGGTMETARKKANRRLRRLAKLRLIRPLGMVQLVSTGRPQIVYGGRMSHPRMLEHSVLRTEIRIHFIGYPFQRSVRVNQTTADAMVEIDDTKFFIEVDTGRMDQRQMQMKWMRYGDCPGYILVVCLTENRLKKLKEGAKRVKDVALFSTFDRLRSKQNEPWEDCDGKTTNL